MRWDLETIAAATGGRATGRAVVTGVAIDSRAVGAGSLFVALAGEHVDGHDYAADAVAAGASAVLVEAGRLPEGVAGVEVSDTMAALLGLAVARRRELDIPVAAITGSNGKTSTKDLLGCALGPGAHAAPRSFNNEIGVPLTVLGTPDHATALVLEIGSRGPGHIALLAPAAVPDVAVITNIGRAHLETFGDLDGVVEAKWELIEALGPDGTAVLPADDRRLVGRRRGPMVTFGEDPDADLWVGNVSMDAAARSTFDIRHDGQTRRITLRMAGRHQPGNAAAAAAAAVAIGTPFGTAVDRIAEAAGSAWRMEIHSGRFTVVNDAYNANPDSTVTALETVAGMPGRHVAILGMMHELGDWAPAGHREVGRAAADLGYAAVVVVGEDPGIAEGAGVVAHPVANVADAAELLDSLLIEGDVVLIKASRAEGLERLADRLIGGDA
jgi:UDP-N-acetylmuramoyl-tripeptide--D-alanyl-D-alanine ligase